MECVAGLNGCVVGMRKGDNLLSRISPCALALERTKQKCWASEASGVYNRKQPRGGGGEECAVGENGREKCGNHVCKYGKCENHAETMRSF